MVKVKMLATARGANEGHTVRDYVKGEVYEISRDLAFNFLHDKVAEELPDETETVTEAVTKSKRSKAAAPLGLPGVK